MKAMKGRILQKLSSIPRLGSLKTSRRVLRLNASDGFSSPPRPPGPRLHLAEPPSPRRALRELPQGGEQQETKLGDHQQQHHSSLCQTPTPDEPDVVDVAELMRGLEEDDDISCNKENIRPTPSPPVTKDRTPPTPGKAQPFSSHSGSRGRRRCAPSTLEHSPFPRPDPESVSLFDPDLLAAFDQAVMDHIRSYEEEKGREGEEENDLEEKQTGDSPGAFELRCPPGGGDAVVLYTTSLRGIRKTFEDCNKVRLLLGTLRVGFYERDVSMHRVYREELWGVLGGRAIPPRLFVRGRYVGGADEVLWLHERGRLLPLLRGLTTTGVGPCRGCGGVGFVVCGECSGSRKVARERWEETARCLCCNENGLVVCALCGWSSSSCCPS